MAQVPGGKYTAAANQPVANLAQRQVMYGNGTAPKEAFDHHHNNNKPVSKNTGRGIPTVNSAGSSIPTVQGRLQALVKSIDSSAELSGEVEDILVSLVTEFVRTATREASKVAVHRTPEGQEPRLELQDLKFVVDKYGIHVPGFDEGVPHRGGRVMRPSEAHEDRMALKKRKLGGEEEAGIF